MIDNMVRMTRIVSRQIIDSEEDTEKHGFLVEYQLLYLQHHLVALYCVVLFPVVELSL